MGGDCFIYAGGKKNVPTMNDDDGKRLSWSCDLQSFDRSPNQDSFDYLTISTMSTIDANRVLLEKLNMDPKTRSRQKD